VSTSFIITEVTERDLPEFDNYRDQAVQGLHSSTIFDTHQFHWFELRMKNDVIRIEAMRDKPEPDEDHRYEWPDRFRIIREYYGERTEKVIERGPKGSVIATFEIYGTRLFHFHPLEVIDSDRFIAISFKVGRLTKTILPKGEQES
jgi:hypothetical protein